eukprot:scaffold32819_cov17-Tisochrysis_lutea.AAC.1
MRSEDRFWLCTHHTVTWTASSEQAPLLLYSKKGPYIVRQIAQKDVGLRVVGPQDAVMPYEHMSGFHG